MADLTLLVCVLAQETKSLLIHSQEKNPYNLYLSGYFLLSCSALSVPWQISFLLSVVKHVEQSRHSLIHSQEKKNPYNLHPSGSFLLSCSALRVPWQISFLLIVSEHVEQSHHSFTPKKKHIP